MRNKMTIAAILLLSLLVFHSCGKKDSSPTKPENGDDTGSSINKIAFNNVDDGLGSDHALAIINPDGKELVKVGQSMYTENFEWSPDGTRLIWTNGNKSSNSGDEICWCKYDGSSLTQMSIYGFYPIFSHDNSLIAFVRPPEPYYLYVMNADGSNVRQLTKHAGGDLRFINNDKTIEFTNYYSNYGLAPGRYSINIDGSNFQQLPDEFDPGSFNIRSNDGRRILFWKGTPHVRWDLYIVNADRTGETLVLGNVNDWEYPFASWSPDDKKIVFTARNTLDIINSDGSNRYKLIDFNARYTEPRWSPK